MTRSDEPDAPPCEVHVPGRDRPSPWCAACRVLGQVAEHDAPELTDEDGYPTDEALDFLRTFTGSAHRLVDHLAEAMRAYGGVKVERGTDDFDRPIRRVSMVTGGWSGNEEIVSHLQRSFFWFAYWEMSQRGGAFTFHVPEERWDQPMIEWPPARVPPPVEPAFSCRHCDYTCDEHGDTHTHATPSTEGDVDVRQRPE